MSFTRLDYFRDPVSFWNSARIESPHSVFARGMYEKLVDMKTLNDREKVLHELHALDPNYPGINYELGMLCIDHQYYKLAKYYLKTEIRTSGMPGIYLQLAKVYFYQSKIDSEAWYLEKAISEDTKNYSIRQRLATIYFQNGQKAKALQIIRNMRRNGIEIPESPDSIAKITNP